MKKSGRDAEIRTRDPLTPSQVRYQAALHPDTGGQNYFLFFFVIFVAILATGFEAFAGAFFGLARAT